MTSLGLCYWNVHGHKSKCIGDKLCDSEFLSLLRGRDIVGIGELHAEGNVSIPGFINRKQKIREKNLKAQRLQGE